jgi:hypothetical protein
LTVEHSKDRQPQTLNTPESLTMMVYLPQGEKNGQHNHN